MNTIHVSNARVDVLHALPVVLAVLAVLDTIGIHPRMLNHPYLLPLTMDN